MPTPAVSTRPMTEAQSAVCSKCGTIKKSGKRSCCAAGGAWFQKCGHFGESEFDHTWLEGIEACSNFAGSVFVIKQSKIVLGNQTTIVQKLHVPQQLIVSDTGSGYSQLMNTAAFIGLVVIGLMHM